MAKYTLIAEHEDGPKFTMEFEQDYLPGVVENFEMFLRGVGFYFDGNLDFVEDNEKPETFDFSDSDTISITGATTCPICKLTDKQLGDNYCYEKNCPKMV